MSPRVSPRDSTQRRKVELWARNVREFCLNADLHVKFRNLLYAVKLRHGTDGFTSPPKEGFFFRPKNPTASAGCEPANVGTKGQHATSRPPKPLFFFRCKAENFSDHPRTRQRSKDEVSQMLALESILQLGNEAVIRQTRILTSEAYPPKC